MIVFENAAQALVRAGEEEIGGRRIAGRLLPYGAEAEPGVLRFDPLTLRFAEGRAEATLAVGPANAEPWRLATSRLPPGPVLVGPPSSAEEVRGAYRAAAEGALSAGRPVFLLDPNASGLPDSCAGAVALCSFTPGADGPFPALAAARARGLLCGVLFPLVPDWTAEPETLETLLAEAVAGGARAATPLVPVADGDSRRAIVEARSSASPPAADDFFDRIHHRDWVPAMAERLADAWRRCAAHGLGILPPRPLGTREPAANAAACARLEARAELEALPEHRAASLRAAVRWIDECGRDLAAVAREGNFRKVFPFDPEVAAEAESALAPSR